VAYLIIQLFFSNYATANTSLQMQVHANSAETSWYFRGGNDCHFRGKWL